MLDVRRVLVLVEVARTASITAAARAMNYTPSAVSQQLKRLEGEAAQPLLVRHPHGVTLTDAGLALVARGERISRQLQAAEEELADFAGMRAGTLRVGTFPTAGASLLPAAVTAFRRSHPDVRIAVRSARIDGLWTALENHETELSLMWDYDWCRIQRRDAHLEPLLADPPVVLVGEDHRLAKEGREEVALAELRDDPWVIRAEAHPVAEALMRSCQEAGFTPQIAFEAHDYQEAQAMVAAGIGVALAPRLAVAGVRPGVRVLRAHAPAPVRRILLVRLAGTPQAPAAGEFAAVLRRHVRELGSELGELVEQRATD